jgi:hypothetical protein
MMPKIISNTVMVASYVSCPESARTMTASGERNTLIK